MSLIEKSIRLARKIHVCDQQFNVYAFIYDRNKLLSIGKNDMKSTSGRALYFANRYNLKHTKLYPFRHAEVDAISRLWGKRYLSRETIVVVRLLKNFETAAAKPCKDCAEIIEALGLKVLHT